MKKILHVYSDVSGGSSKAASTIFNKLKNNDKTNNHTLLTFNKNGNKEKLSIIIFISKIINSSLNKIFSFFFKNYHYCNFFSKLNYQKINSIDHDILILYWVSNAIFDYDLMKIKSERIIWRLSDLNPITNSLPYGDVKKTHFLNIFFYKKRVRLLKSKKIEFICPSNLTYDFCKENLPQNLIYKINTLSRIPKLKNIKNVFEGNCTWGALNYKSDKRKGISDFKKISDNIIGNQKFLVYGDEMVFDNKNIISYGVLDFENLISKIFKKTDIAIHLSKNDNSPQQIIEYLSHGIPVIAYDIKGLNDHIIDGFNGYLVPEDQGYHGFIKKINLYFDSSFDNKKTLSKNASFYFLKNFSDDDIINRWLEII